MCRNIHTLYNYEPPATEEEVRDAALQYVRKISGSTKPSKANETALTAPSTRSRLRPRGCSTLSSRLHRRRTARPRLRRSVSWLRSASALPSAPRRAGIGARRRARSLTVENVRLDGDRRLVGGDDVRSLRLPSRWGRGRSAPARSPRRSTLARQHLELASLGDAGLVDVAGEDELGAGRRQLLEHAAAARERSLARAPRRVGELMVQADDAQCAGRCAAEPLGGALHSIRPEASRLVPPRPDRVDADHVQPAGRVHGLRRLPLALELLPGRMNRAGGSNGMSWLPGTASTGAGRLRRRVARARAGRDARGV